MSFLGRVINRFTTRSESPAGAPASAGLSSEVVALRTRCAQLEQERNVFRSESGYWKAMHAKAVEREKALGQQVDALSAKLKLREHQLFGRKSERTKKKSEGLPPGAPETVPPGSSEGLPPGSPEGSPPESPAAAPPKPKRKRGHAFGAPGHGRRDYGHLEVNEDPVDLPHDEKHCPTCELPFKPFGSEDSEILEIEVRAHRRRVCRKRYLRTCECSSGPRVITAPAPPRLIPRGRFGISVWAMILVDKFLFQRPTYRLLASLQQLYGLAIPVGTITDGLKRLAPLFEPLYEAIVKQQLSESRWHADETRWMVFAESPGKQGHRWYLWVFLSKTTTVFRLEPTRSADVPKAHFGEDARGILSVDRYAAYKCLLKDGRLILAFCWAHVRRDFLEVARDWPVLEAWGLSFVERIGELYHLNRERLAVLDKPEALLGAQGCLDAALEKMECERDAQLKDETLHPAARKVLLSLKNHWAGLMVFVSHPEVPMDNSEAEREIRNEAVGRKCYYGSGSLWSARLAALLFSVFQTLFKWDINPRLWLNSYLLACAGHGGKAPPDACDFLPWNLSEQALFQLKNSGPQRPAPLELTNGRLLSCEDGPIEPRHPLQNDTS